MGIDIRKPFRRKKTQNKVQRIDLFASVMADDKLHFCLISNIIGDKDITLREVIYNTSMAKDDYIKKYSPGLFFCVSEKTGNGISVEVVSSMEKGCSPKLMKAVNNNKNLELALTTLDSKLFAGLSEEDAAEPTTAYVKQ